MTRDCTHATWPPGCCLPRESAGGSLHNHAAPGASTLLPCPPGASPPCRSTVSMMSVASRTSVGNWSVSQPVFTCTGTGGKGWLHCPDKRARSSYPTYAPDAGRADIERQRREDAASGAGTTASMLQSTLTARRSSASGQMHHLGWYKIQAPAHGPRLQCSTAGARAPPGGPPSWHQCCPAGPAWPPSPARGGSCAPPAWRGCTQC